MYLYIYKIYILKSETKQLLSEENESIEKAFSSLVDEKLTLAWVNIIKIIKI